MEHSTLYHGVVHYGGNLAPCMKALIGNGQRNGRFFKIFDFSCILNNIMLSGTIELFRKIDTVYGVFFTQYIFSRILYFLLAL